MCCMIRRLVLDIMKPHEPPMHDVAVKVADTDGVSGVNAKLIETDSKVQNIKITVEGEDIDYESVKRRIERLGGSVHSVDEVACGETIVEESITPQD